MCQHWLCLDRACVNIHEQNIQSGCECDSLLGLAWLPCMQNVGIGKCWRMFNMMPSLDMVAWIAMVLGHVKCGDLGRRH